MRSSLYHSKSTRANKSMYLIVVLPEKENYYVENYDDPEERDEIHEWWAENTVDFLNELQLVYAMLSEGNDEWRFLCEKAQRTVELGYPKNVKYMWRANRDTKPKELPVDVYIDHVLFWVNSQVENEDIFPTEEDIPFPDNFKDYLVKMFKRMFRIFAIMYSNPCLCDRNDVENSLEPIFKHFLYFAWKWGLLEPRETKCIDHITGPWKQKFDKEERLYRNHKLSADE